jgi:hypothetical protein
MSFMRYIVVSFVAALAVAIALAPSAARAAGVDFLVPGMSLDALSIEPGARVSYLVVSKSFGAADSSYVELRVLDRKGGAFRLEVVSSPYPRSKKESVTIRLRLAERVTAATSPESVRSCLLDVAVKEGTGAFRAPTDRELDDMDIESIFLGPSDRLACAPLGSARVTVPAGTFACEGAEYSRNETKAVDLGGTAARRIEEERSRVWISRDVPFWGLVKSSVEKKSLTESAGAPSSASRPRETSTEAMLLSFSKPRRRP